MLAWRVLIPLGKPSSRALPLNSEISGLYSIVHDVEVWASGCKSHPPDFMTPASLDIKNDVALPEDSLGDPLGSLSIELGRISAEIHSINSDFQAQMQQVVAQVRESMENQYQAR